MTRRRAYVPSQGLMLVMRELVLSAAAVCLIVALTGIVGAQNASGAAQVPALLDVTPGVAAAHPELIAQRNNLMAERKTLGARRDRHNASCKSVEEDSSEYANCLSSRAQLLEDLKKHIANSNSYNAAIQKAQEYCVKFKGYDLIFALQDCENKQPSVISTACLKGIGITQQALTCVGAIPGVTRSLKGGIEVLASCGIAAATIPADALLKCRDINDVCVTNALHRHKDEVARCLP